MTPLIVFSELGKRWYVVTRYTDRGNGNICAQRKYDVTEQMEKILKSPKLTTYQCDCGLPLLVEGQVIGKQYQGETGKDSQQ